MLSLELGEARFARSHGNVELGSLKSMLETASVKSWPSMRDVWKDRPGNGHPKPIDICLPAPCTLYPS